MTPNKLRTLLSLIAVAVLAVACNTPQSSKLSGPVKLHESINGGYLQPKDSPNYFTVGGVLYASDGVRFYTLRSHEIDAGEIKGRRIVLPERWIVSGGSRVTYYHRTPSTFRDQDLMPVFIQQ